MWLLKWWTRGGQLTLMRSAASGGQEPAAPAAKSSPAHLSELPSKGSQVTTEFSKAACWAGSCCILMSAKAGRHRAGILGAAVWMGAGASQDLLKPAVVGRLLASLHLPASWIPVSWVCLFCCWCCLLHILVCVFISSLCHLFSLCLSLHRLPPTLPWCCARCSIKAAKMKNASSDVHIGSFFICLFGFSFLFCLMLVSVEYGWKEKKGMLEYICPGGCR